MKRNIGDRVRIKSIDWYKENKDTDGKVWTSGGQIPFDKCMSKWCGKVMTISHVRVDHYTMVEDLVGYWTDDMIEGLAEESTIKIKDLRKFINQMETEGLNDETVLTFETKRSSEHIENITSMEYSPTTNILIFS
ncbi:MAG: hypothetical protein J6J23_02915 [Clostridia bacterium]|nr:hypothetical protein [Clostridia bacterium]